MAIRPTHSRRKVFRFEVSTFSLSDSSSQNFGKPFFGTSTQNSGLSLRLILISFAEYGNNYNIKAFQGHDKMMEEMELQLAVKRPKVDCTLYNSFISVFLERILEFNCSKGEKYNQEGQSSKELQGILQTRSCITSRWREFRRENLNRDWLSCSRSSRRLKLVSPTT